MIRARFKVDHFDYRPVVWPIKHPYWCTGYDSNCTPILVAYADNIEEIKTNWPEAESIDAEEVDSYTFTSRFPKPDWFTLPQESLAI
jgi:hypothetical protein